MFLSIIQSSIGRAGVQWNMPVLSYFISVFSKSRSRGTGAMAGRPFLINVGGGIFLATSGMTDSSLMETDFFGGTLGWGVMLLFVGIWPGAPTGGLLTPKFLHLHFFI